MSYAPAPHRGRYVLRFVLAAIGLGLAALAVRGLSHVVAGQLTMLLAGTLTIVVPGWAAAGVLELDRDRGPVTAWGLVPLLGVAVWAPLGLVGLLIGLPFLVVLGGVAVITAAMIAAGPCLRAPPFVDAAAMLVLGGLAAAIGWQWQSWLIGDGLFHAGVIRKLLALSAPDERSIWPFVDGHPHAGYAFPLLHLSQAAAIWISSLDTGAGYPDLVPLFALMLPVVAYAVGVRAGGRITGAVTALLALWIACTGDNIISTAQQPRYFVTLVALPTLLLLLLEQADDPQPVIEWLIVICLLVITVCHLTYAPPLVAAMIVVALFNPQLWRATLVSAVTSGLVVAVIYVVAVHGAGPNPQVPPAAGAFITVGGHHLSLSGLQLFDHRAETVLAVAAAIWGIRRPRTAVGILALIAAVVYLLCTLPGIVPLAGAVVGLGQVQRYWEMIPWAYVLGPAVVLVARSRAAVIAIAATAALSLLLQRTHLLYGHAADALAVLGMLVLVAAALQAIAQSSRRVRRRPPRGRPERARDPAAVAALALLLAIAVVAGSISVHARAVASSLVYGRPQPTLGDRLTPGALAYLRSRPGLPVVLAPFRATPVNWYSGLAYELVGNAPLYAAAISSYHTESERKDNPQERRWDVNRFLDPSTSQQERHRILEKWGVDEVVVDLRTAPPQLVRELDADPALTSAYHDPPQSSENYAQIGVWTVDRSKLGA